MFNNSSAVPLFRLFQAGCISKPGSPSPLFHACLKGHNATTALNISELKLAVREQQEFLCFSLSLVSRKEMGIGNDRICA